MIIHKEEQGMRKKSILTMLVVVKRNDEGFIEKVKQDVEVRKITDVLFINGFQGLLIGPQNEGRPLAKFMIVQYIK
jgi:hypothetical protein